MLKAESTARHDIAINEATIRERILKSAVTVAEWATVRLVRDPNSEGIIGELYADYVDYCRRENLSPLLRKTWIGAMKLAGFQTESGAFVRLALRD